MKWLVTGGTGFVGARFAKVARERGHTVIATSQHPQPAQLEAQILRLPDRKRALEVLRAVRPDVILHLAGITSVPGAESDPAAAVRVNVEGTISLLEAIEELDRVGDVRWIQVSSAHVYDSERAGSAPIDETVPLGPATVYGKTKLAAELCAEALASSSRRHVVIFRPFNHTGSGQRADFVLSSFAKQIAEMERKRREPTLEVGNLDVQRDFTDVSDVVEAYLLAGEGKVPAGTYNLASGVAAGLRELLQMLMAQTSVRFELREVSSRTRTREVKRIVGSARKLTEACGWKPKIPLEHSVRSLLDGWRENLDA